MITSTPKLILVLCLFLSSLSSWSSSHFLELLKSGKQKYDLRPGCLNFIQRVDQEDVKSQDLMDSFQLLEDLYHASPYFFHYTKDEGGQLKAAVRNQNFEAVIDHSLTHSATILNAAGPGLYLAGNPFSSKAYGDNQLALKLDSKSKVYNHVTNSGLLTSAIFSMEIKYPDFRTCDFRVQATLVLSMNGADLLYYNDQDEWFVLLNKDVIKKSDYTHIGNKDQIIRDMLSEGKGKYLLRIIQGFGGTPPNVIPPYRIDPLIFSQKTPDGVLIELSKKLSTWDSDQRESLAFMIAQNSEPSLSRLIDYFKTTQIPLSVYDTLPLSDVSPDYLRWYSIRMASDPSIQRNWSKSNLERNTLSLFMAGILSDEELLNVDLPNWTFQSAFSKLKESKKATELQSKKLLIAALASREFQVQPDIMEYLRFSPTDLLDILSTKDLVQRMSLANFKSLLEFAKHDSQRSAFGHVRPALEALSVEKAMALVSRLLGYIPEDYHRLLIGSKLNPETLTHEQQVELLQLYTNPPLYLKGEMVAVILEEAMKLSRILGDFEPLFSLLRIDGFSPLILSQCLDNREVFEECLASSKNKNPQLPQMIINTFNPELTSKLLPYLEHGYPRQEYLSYVGDLVGMYAIFEKEHAVQIHFKDFLCKKINGYHALDELVKKKLRTKGFIKEFKKKAC